MYDIKTHDAAYIQHNKEFYEDQLNVYAHVWQELRKNKLDLTAVISTTLPKGLREALRLGNVDQIDKEIAGWDPVIPISIQQEKVAKTIKAFAEVVDKIEDGEFPCPSLDVLKSKVTDKDIFAANVCGNCDGRFACEAYREYARGATKGKAGEFMKYFSSSIDKDEQEEWLSANDNFENE
jgi:hypothetical protein